MTSYLKKIVNLIICVLVICISSCTFNTKFDRRKWVDSDRAFPSQYRDGMLIDLITNYKLKGLTEKQLIDLLGTPDHAEANGIYYNINIEYGGDTDPVYSKKLEFICSKDKIVESFSLKEWKSK